MLPPQESPVKASNMNNNAKPKDPTPEIEMMESDDEFEKTLSMLDDEEIQQKAKKPRIDPQLTAGRSSREGRFTTRVGHAEDMEREKEGEGGYLVV